MREREMAGRVRMRWRQKRFSKKLFAVYSTLSGVLMRRRGGLDDRIWQPNLIRPLMVYHQLWNALERTNLITTTSSALPILYVPPLHIFKYSIRVTSHSDYMYMSRATYQKVEGSAVVKRLPSERTFWPSLRHQKWTFQLCPQETVLLFLGFFSNQNRC